MTKIGNAQSVATTPSTTANARTLIPDFTGHLPKLIVTDMDGTLLNEDKQIPESFWPVIEKLLDDGVFFSPASGRQCATLQRQFARIADRISIIAENGNFVVHRGEVVSATSITPETVRVMIREIRAYNERRVAAGRSPLGMVVCGHNGAYMERYPKHFDLDWEAVERSIEETKNYYVRLELLDDVLDALARDNIVKLAMFDNENVEDESADFLRSVSDELQAVISGAHWLDLIVATTNKGTALADLQRSLGVSPAETICFVDYLNDLELIDHTDHSFAMENGHPEIKRRATYIAPPNTEEGVVTTLKAIYGI